MYSFSFYFYASLLLSFDLVSESGLLSSLSSLFIRVYLFYGVTTYNSLLSSFSLNFFLSPNLSFSTFYDLPFSIFYDFFGVIISFWIFPFLFCYNSIFITSFSSFSEAFIFVSKGEFCFGTFLYSPLLFFITEGNNFPFKEDKFF